MEGVEAKLRGDVYLRANKHIPPPHTHPAWRMCREITNVTRQIAIPTKEQLREDTT